MAEPNDKQMFAGLQDIFDVDGKGDTNANANISLTVGVVVDTDDPLQEGRLRVFCPSYNDSPEKLQHLPWAAYVSPFGGVINNKCFVRGADPSNATTNGAVHYGFWGVPEQGAHALVGCIDGDSRRRFWLGCFPSHQETHTMFHGRFKWNGFDGAPDGPFSSSNEPIQPIYDNLTDAFGGDRQSREWKTRGADYQATAVNQDAGQTPNSDKSTYLDEQNSQIASAEPDQWVKDILGAHGYDWTSLKSLGAFLASKVYGMSTPGGHALSMDDRAFNCRTKLKSTTGHMILMDDTNERIYIMTNKGNNWIEMDSAGNIDVFSGSRVSVHAASDINFSTEGSFRVKATKGIFMYAGNTAGSPLGAVPPDGQIRMHASDDMHLYSNQNIREFAGEKIFIEASSDINVKSANWYQVTSGALDLTSDGSINLLAATDVLAGVGSSTFLVNSSVIASTASGNVYFSGGGVSGSITSINNTFLTKQSGSGSGVQSDSGPSVSPPSITVNASDTQISIWTNRVPQHEPWPRVMMQDSSAPVNSTNQSYKNNVAWTPQFDNNTSPNGMEPIGRIEGDATIPRGMFWRR